MGKKKKYQNNDEDPRIFRYYPIIILFALAFFGVSLGIGLAKGIDWLVTLGVVELAVTISVMSLSRTIYFFWVVASVAKENDEEEERKKEGKPSAEDEYEQFSEYYECDGEGNAVVDKPANTAQTAEPAQSVESARTTGPAAPRDIDIDAEVEKVVSAYERSKSSEDPKDWSIGDKLIVYSLVGSIAITLLTFMVGIFFANLGIESVGFPLMGAGGGGFALIIVILIIVSNVKEHRSKNPRPKRRRKSKDRDAAPVVIRSSTSEYRPTEMLRRGTVVYCEVEKARSRKGSPETRYKITVMHGEAENHITLESFKQYNVGDTVKFYQSCEHPNKGRLAEYDD